MAKYFNKLESLRGLAAIAVVLYHSPFYKEGNINPFVSNSYLFVDFFFILSGFVMSNAYQEKIANGFKLRDYFWLRLGRIYPLHLFFLLVWGVYIFIKWILFTKQIELTNPLIKNTFASFVTNLFLVHSLNFHNYTNWNFPSWSISVEFATYFIFFAFAFLTRKLKNPLIPLFIAVASYYYVLNGDNWKTLDFTVINGIYRCIGGFFAGVFLFQATKKISNLNIYMTNILEIVAVILVICIVALSGKSPIFLFSVIPAFIFAVYVFSLEKDGLIGKILQLNFLINIGVYSYSIYLTHALILDIAFSLTQYLILKPTEIIYFYQSDYSYLINLGLISTIIVISKFTYIYIEKRWVERSKNLVEKLNESDKFEQKKGSILSLD